MILFCISHSFHYELENLFRLFFPLEKITVKREYEKTEEDYLYTELEPLGESTRLLSRLSLGGSLSENSSVLSDECAGDFERELAKLSFALLTEKCGFVPKWGILTGVRPSKLMMNLINSLGETGAVEYFTKELLVSPEKAELAKTVAAAEKRITDMSQRDSCSLYISIPFCPSRCSYCSFVSHSISSPSAKKLIPDYVEKLCEEIRLTGQKVRENNLKIMSVYWGGGTPTTLSAPQLDTVLTAIEQSFNLSGCLEYTVEAGRPDTVTKEKLVTLKKHGVNRISINPQTFSDEVLLNIGRRHTVADTVDRFHEARELGFDNINTDLIAGLPGDTLESFRHSIDSAIALSPENITVHTLALKRSSTIVTQSESGTLDKNITADMLRYASDSLYKAGYTPYYMYRQSKSLGNLENVGWCKKGRDCLYNVFMMEECHSVFSAGAGGVTKLVEPGGKHIERIFNYKYPFEYISRFEELAARKNGITQFFTEYKL